MMHTIGNALVVLFIIALGAATIIDLFFEGACNDRPDID